MVNPHIERMNYENDHRVRAAREGDWYESFCEETMTATVVFHTGDDGEIVEEFELPVKYEVCMTCGGKGSHVNPSIDACGISSDDFDDDPDFEEEYFSGAYNVTCYGCAGKRLVVEIDRDRLTGSQAKVVERIQDWRAFMEECEEEARQERIMGC